MKKTIDWCITNDILKPFLITHGSEVTNMLMTEWNLEDALVIEREEERQAVARTALAEGVPLILSAK